MATLTWAMKNSTRYPGSIRLLMLKPLTTIKALVWISHLFLPATSDPTNPAEQESQTWPSTWQHNALLPTPYIVQPLREWLRDKRFAYKVT
jgi:hypothetical protein